VKLAILRPEPEPKAPSELLDVLAVSHEEEAGEKNSGSRNTNIIRHTRWDEFA